MCYFFQTTFSNKRENKEIATYFINKLLTCYYYIIILHEHTYHAHDIVFS